MIFLSKVQNNSVCGPLQYNVETSIYAWNAHDFGKYPFASEIGGIYSAKHGFANVKCTFARVLIPVSERS